MKEFDPLGAAKTFEYDDAGRLWKTIDRLGRRIERAYDAANRLTGESWYSPTGQLQEILTYTYYKDNQLHTADGYLGLGSGTITETYDNLGRNKTEQDINGITLTLGYNKRDDRTSLSDGNGGVVSVYDKAHRLETATLSANSTTQKVKFTYSDRDQVTKVERFNVVSGNDVLVSQTDKGYDNGGRLTSLVHKDAAGVAQYTYGYQYDRPPDRRDAQRHTEELRLRQQQPANF